MESNANRTNRFAGSVVEGWIGVAREFRWRPPTGDGDLSSGGIRSGRAWQCRSESFVFVVGYGLGEKRSASSFCQ